MALTLRQLAEEAIDIQCAGNPLGLSKRFPEVMEEVRNHIANADGCWSTTELSRHPIIRLWASKFHDMAGMGLSDMEAYSEAYHACRELAGHVTQETNGV